MKTSSSTFQLAGAAVLFLTLPAYAALGEITLSGLLHEMADRDVAASLPAPAYTLRQSSSHDPRKNDPANAEDWHSNNDHDNAIRTEVNGGRNEWVIMEDKGPGAVVRYWTPLAPDRENQIIRSYDYGILRFTVNGKPAAKEVDFYHPEAMLAEPVELGTFQAKDGKLLLRAEVVGANAASCGPRFYCGFDCIALH